MVEKFDDNNLQALITKTLLVVGVAAGIVERLVHRLAGGRLGGVGGHLLHALVVHHLRGELGLRLLQAGVRLMVDAVHLGFGRIRFVGDTG